MAAVLAQGSMALAPRPAAPPARRRRPGGRRLPRRLPAAAAAPRTAALRPRLWMRTARTANTASFAASARARPRPVPGNCHPGGVRPRRRFRDTPRQWSNPQPLSIPCPSTLPATPCPACRRGQIAAERPRA